MNLKEIIKKNIVHVCGEGMFNKIINLFLYIKYPNGKEHIKHNRYGMNPDKMYYLIRRKPGGKEEGMLSIFTYVMGRVDFADRNGMIPVVDIDLEGEPSVWNRYFVPKNGLSKKDICNCANIMLSGYDSKPVYPGWCNWINTDFNKEKKALFDKYFDFSPEIKKAVKCVGGAYIPKNVLAYICGELIILV